MLPYLHYAVTYILLYRSLHYGTNERDLICNYEHFSKKKNLFKSFVKIELSYVFTINRVSTAESCMEQ